MAAPTAMEVTMATSSEAAHQGSPWALFPIDHGPFSSGSVEVRGSLSGFVDVPVWDLDGSLTEGIIVEINVVGRGCVGGWEVGNADTKPIFGYGCQDIGALLKPVGDVVGMVLLVSEYVKGSLGLSVGLADKKVGLELAEYVNS